MPTSPGSPVRVKTRFPFEVTMLVAAFLSAFLLFVFGEEPNSIAQTLPTYASIAWNVGLLVGPGLALVGISFLGLTAKPWTLIAEQVGLSITGAVCSFYGAAILIVNGLAGLTPGFTTIAFAFACYWQVYEIQRAIQRAVRNAEERHA